ncbi:hypothetical protein LCGC14_2805150 [marine sediment metagenome]|uniref:Copper resistance protein D domain-containing protein n=1 Tax=marine sediment metagenome TaxID=412755 RepID=A0A0F9BCV4_9ZZZZ
MDIIIAIIDWLHLIATIIWIGAMIILLLIVIPSVKNSLQNEEISNKFMKSIGKKMTFLVNISIILLIITGIFLGIFLGIKSTDWVILLILKHLTVLIMVVIHICRIKIIAPLLQKKGKENPTSKSYLKLKSLQMNLVWVNLVLGMITLFISVIL